MTAPGISQNQIAAADFASAAAAYGLPNGGLYDSFGHLQKVTASILDVNVAAVVNVNEPRFGAVGDGVTDDTAAIQKAIDTGADVVFPSANYLITAPLQVGSQRLIGGVEHKLANRAQTVLTVSGNHAAFVNKAGEPSFEIDGFWINFGDTTPTDPATQGDRMGFKFTTNGLWPAFIAIRNCTVRGAWEAFFDDTGTYQAILERIWARNCKRAFFKKNGTTTTFNTCFAIDGEQGFYVENVLSATIINSGADNLVPSAARNTANYFKDVPGLSIVGWDAEYNTIAGNEVSYMRFDNVVGTVAGLVGYQNTLNCDTAQESYFMSARLGSRLHFTGCKAAASAGDLLFLGSAGSCMTVVATGGAQVLLSGSNFSAPTGGTPAARWSALADGSSSITFTQTTLDNQQTALALVGQDTNGQVGLGGVALAERGSAPAAIANTGVLYTVDNGSGKTRLMVRFGTGAAQQLAIEP